MTQCEECGARNAENATFCVRCGAELTHAEETSVGEDTDTLAPVVEETAGDEADLPATAPPDATAISEPWQASEEIEIAVSDADVGGEAEALLNEASERLADGDPDGAAAKCREAIEVAPDLVAAYSLLGMAEEQRGNTVAAAGAYRRVLQLDPDRKVEREKLEALYAEGSASPHGEESERDGNRVLAWAPWVAAVAAAFFVMMTLTAVGLRVHASNQADEIYSDQMAIASASLDAGDYREAADAFETVLTVRPDDSDAQRGLRYARRKMTTRTGVASATAPEIAGQETYQASIVPSRGPNPFPSVPIGPGQAADDQSEPVQGQPSQTQTQRARSAPPPVMSTDERVEVRRPSTTAPTQEAMPFEPEVLEEPAEEPPATADEPEETAPAQTEERPRGEITIWRSPRTESEAGGQASPPQQSTNTQHAERAQTLRGQAQAAIRQGNCQQGQQLLDQAIDQYRADTAANPAKRQANQAAINSLQTLRQQCETGENQ